MTLALGEAFAEIWDTPRLEQPRGLKARARGLALLVILGATLVASTVAAGLAVGGGIGPAAGRGAALAGSLAVNVVAFLTVFALLTPRPRRSAICWMASDSRRSGHLPSSRWEAGTSIT
ncbi:MAG: hypothetical protein ACXVHB_25040 [Solirubrobacteraceae bacterium]